MKSSADTQLQVAISSLLESTHDRSPIVTKAVSTALEKLSEKHPNQLLLSCIEFSNNKKPPQDHQVRILELMSKVSSDQLVNLDGETILKSINFGLKLMTENVNYEPHIQIAASDILVALGRLHYIEVIEALMKNLSAGTVPHYTILHTFGALAGRSPFAVIPYLKDILNIIVPLLGGLKGDHFKQAFAYGIQNFCEALLEYVSNLEQAPDPTINLESFKTEFGMVYDVIYSSWLHSRDTKVIEVSLEALGAIFVILPVDKVSQQIPKIIIALLNLYKRPLDHFIITKCLHAVLTKASSVNGMLLEPLLPQIFNNLSELVCTNPDYVQPNSVKCHSEALRCYESIAVHFTDTTIDKLLVHLKNNNDKDKLKGVIVITHLISYSGDQVINRRLKDILRHLNELLSGGHVKVKKMLIKLVVALAHKRVLNNKEINPDGPEIYLEFLLKMCCKQPTVKGSETSISDWDDIQQSADNAIYVITTSLPELNDILFNLLLKSYIGVGYDDAIIVILRCLTHLAGKSTIKSEEAFVRSMILLSCPLPSMRGTLVLNFLKSIAPCDLESYKSVWNVKLPHLMKYLDQNYDGFNEKEWQDQVFDFFNLILENVNNLGFTEILLKRSQSQLELYNNMKYPQELSMKLAEKRFLFKFVAIILTYLKLKEAVLHTLDSLLLNVRLTDFKELHACAEAIGITSRIHLQIVLEKLQQIRKDVLTKKSSKIFSFIKTNSNELGLERLRYVILNSYAEICLEAPTAQLLPIIEKDILDFVLNQLENAKEFPIKRACLKAVESVADALHPVRNQLHIKMSERKKVIEAVVAQMQLHSGPDYIELFPLILSAMTSLIKLPLPLETEERVKLMKTFFDNVFNASAIYCRINPTLTDTSYFGELKLVPFVTKSFTELNSFVQELLLQDLGPAALDEIVTLLEEWLGKKKQEQRLPSIETLRIVLQTYLDQMRFAHDLPSSFGQTGVLLARIVPRCTDPNKNIRKVAVECVCLTLCIAGRYEGHLRDHDKLLSTSLRNVQQNIESDDPKLLFNLTSDLAQVISKNLPHFQIYHFIEGLCEALVDCESSSSVGASVVLNTTLKNNGGELQNHINVLTGHLLGQLNKIQCQRTRNSALRGLLHLANHHSRIVGGILLMQPLPYDNSVCDCWMILSTDEALVQDLLDQIKKLVKINTLYEVQGNSGDVKVASLAALQAISALHELVKNTQLKGICLAQFPELFSLLLICLASFRGCAAPATRKSNEKEKYGLILNRDAYKLNPAKVAFDTLRLFLVCCELSNISTLLLSFSAAIESPEDLVSFLKIVETLVNSLCLDMPQTLSFIVQNLGPFIRSDLEPQRVAVIGFFNYLFKQGTQKDQIVLIENLLEMILDVQLDTSCHVRKLALEALGHAAENLNKDLVMRYCNQILGVLMTSLDYSNIGNESEVILECLLTFSKLLNALDGYKFHSFQVTAAVRIKPLFGQEDCNLRRASLHLLGDLTASLSPDTNLEAFQEQIQGNLITLLLHLCDPDIYVIKACKYTLRKIGPYLESPEVNSMIQKHLIDEATLHFDDFIKDLIKIMAKDLQDLFYLFVMTSVSYLKSPWVSIKSSAALVTGLLYSELSADNRPKVSLDNICDKLLRLMQDDSDEVRSKASQAVSYLFI